MGISTISRTMDACSDFKAKTKSLPQAIRTKFQGSKAKANVTLAKAKADIEYCREEVAKMPTHHRDHLSPQIRLIKDTTLHITYHYVVKPSGKHAYKSVIRPVYRYVIRPPAVATYKKVIRPTTHVLGIAYRFHDDHCVGSIARYNNKFGKEYGYGNVVEYVPPPVGGIPTDYETYVPAPPKMKHTSNMLRDIELFLDMPSAPMKGPNETSSRIMVPIAEDGEKVKPKYEMSDSVYAAKSNGDGTWRPSLELEKCPGLETETSSVYSIEDDALGSVALPNSPTVLPNPDQKVATKTWVLEVPTSDEPLALTPSFTRYVHFEDTGVEELKAQASQGRRMLMAAA